MTTIHHKAVTNAIVDSLQAWLLAKLPAGSTQPPVLGEWPDFQVARPAGKAFLVVAAGDPQITPIAPVHHTTVPGSGASATLIWRVGQFQSAAQIDVFTNTAQLGDELAHIVGQWLTTPPTMGLRVITVTNYWNARFKVRGRSVSAAPDANVLAGQWRQTFAVIVDGPVLSDNIGSVLTRLDVELTAEPVVGTFTLE